MGWDSKATASYWTLTTIVDGQTELFEAQLEKLITRAENILSELIADYNTSIDDATPINIQVDVTPLVGADTLLAWATELQGYVFDYYHADNIIDNYQSLISAVSALIEQLAASYEKPLYLPETSTREKRVLYYIYSVDKAQYLAYDQTSPRYLKYLRTYDFEPTYAIEDEGEAAYLWYFLPTETEGQYYIGNLKSGREVHAVSGKTNIAVDLGSNALPELYTLALNAEQSGFAITGTEGSAWFPNASGYVQMSTKSSGTWLFVKAGTMTDITPITVPTSSQLYDLMGRPVSMPTPGIYILDGKKMIIR